MFQGGSNRPWCGGKGSVLAKSQSKSSNLDFPPAFFRSVTQSNPSPRKGDQYLAKCADMEKLSDMKNRSA